jgi:hypothetical protein
MRNKEKYDKPFSIKIWVDELSSWLVFDNFPTQELANKFLVDDHDNIEKFIKKQIERGNEIGEKKEKANISDADVSEIIEKERLGLPNSGENNS